MERTYLSMGFAPESGWHEIEPGRFLDGEPVLAVIELEGWTVELVHKNHCWVERYTGTGKRPESVTQAIGEWEKGFER